MKSLLLFIQFLGILLSIAGLSLIIKPELLFNWLENNSDKTSIYVAAISARLILGVLFVTIAEKSKYPVIIKVLGYLLIAVASLLFFMGHENFIEFINSFIGFVKPYGLLVGVVVVFFGGFLVQAFYNTKNS